MIGRDKSRAYWRVLKIDRQESTELNIREDPTTYSERECSDLLRRIHEGNKSTGGLKFVTSCYGIVGMFHLLSVAILLENTHMNIVSPFSRVCEIFGTLLHVAYHEKTTDWCDRWSFGLRHFQE